MHKTKYEKIGDVIFPVIYQDNGMVTIDYPSYDPSIAKKITEEGQKRLKEITKLYKEHEINN